MNGGTDHNALDRIDAALARIEAATSANGSAQRDLRHRHEALKSAASRSLAQLDTILAGLKNE